MLRGAGVLLLYGAGTPVLCGTWTPCSVGQGSRCSMGPGPHSPRGLLCPPTGTLSSCHPPQATARPSMTSSACEPPSCWQGLRSHRRCCQSRALQRSVPSTVPPAWLAGERDAVLPWRGWEGVQGATTLGSLHPLGAGCPCVCPRVLWVLAPHGGMPGSPCASQGFPLRPAEPAVPAAALDPTLAPRPAAEKHPLRPVPEERWADATGGYGDTTDRAQATQCRAPHCPNALAWPQGSDAVPGSAQTTCGIALWPMAPATVAHGPRRRRVCAASTGKPRHPMTTGAPVSPAVPWHLPVALGSVGQRAGDSVGPVGTVWGQGGWRRDDGDSVGQWHRLGVAQHCGCACPGARAPAALLPTLLPAGSCHPPATGWRRITAEIPTRTSGARGVTPSTPTSGTRAAALRSAKTVSAASQWHSVLCVCCSPRH